MEADNETDQPTRQGTRWDFAAVDAAVDPQSFVRYLQQRPGGEALDLRRQLSYDLLEVHEGQHLLDVGCGLGDDVRALARLVGASGRVVGLDLSERLLEVARSRSEGAAYPGTFVPGDMHHLPFDTATFDGCRAKQVLSA
jgi:ubiquinone/menaquinone biosynthesis C-methylase UbiE